MSLPENKRKLLADFVNNRCEHCKRPEKDVGNLIAHRLRRGVMGGKYILRNIKMLCNTCHKLFHANEYK